MQGKMAIIGDSDSILAFKAGGVDAYGATDAIVAKETLKKLAKEYDVIFITDDLAKELDEYLNRFLEKPYPIIVPVPSKNGSTGYGMQKLKDEMEAALGVDILFGREDK